MMSGNYDSWEWIWRVFLHSFYMLYFILYSLSWIYFRKSFGWFCLRRIFITLPGKTDTRRRTLDVSYKRLKIWLLFVFVIHSTKTLLHSISKCKTRKYRVYCWNYQFMSKLNMEVCHPKRLFKILPIFLVTVVTRINWGNFASQSGNIFAKFGTKYQVSGRIDEHKFRKGKILLELSNFPNRQSVSSFFIMFYKMKIELISIPLIL